VGGESPHIQPEKRDPHSAQSGTADMLRLPVAQLRGRECPCGSCVHVKRYTYTTMISQCGSHQQLRRALELVAEMRSRGIDCNVHTYSALMNVCIKANELDLAQDVYKQMLEEGCSPNLVGWKGMYHLRRGWSAEPGGTKP
jgi:pentatricopeptide repeat protein